MWNIILWISSLVCAGYFIFSSVFALVMIADLKSDYVNPLEMAPKVNTFWWIDFILFSILSAAYFISGYWFVFLFHLPVFLLNTYCFLKKTHTVDPTTILQRDETTKHRNRALVKLGFSAVSFFLYLYMLITESISNYKRPT
eukprot:TRINITY_DN1729_c0_g1_i5.p1 TRINITY_DN1729_c0_g1~~TRINITY_DN1729_c0_g1_i5.p1  ORF type:complete len:142 (+),score=12.74 TRINITY_DN1729_c0_g1_i5:130-555(+)